MDSVRGSPDWSETVAAIRGALARRAVAVLGPVGSGSTTLAEAVWSRVAGHSSRAIFLRPSQAFSRRPWAALAAADPAWASEHAAPLGSDPHSPALVGAAVARLATADVVVVDDADLLDDLTIVALDRAHPRTVLVVSTERPWQQPLRDLVARCERVPVPVATAADVAAIAEARWGRAPDVLGAHRLWHASEGRIGHVHRILEAITPLVDTSAARARLPELLGTCGDLPAWSEARLGGHSDAAARALRLVAAHPYLTRAEVAAVAGGRAVDEWCAARVLVRHGVHGDRLTIADPLWRTVLAQAVAPTYAREDAIALAEAVGATAAPAAAARWAVAAGRRPDPDGLASALADSLREGDLSSARTLGAAAADVDMPVLLGLRAEQLAASGEVDEAIAVARRAAASEDPAASGRARLVGADLMFFRRADPWGALDLLGMPGAVDERSADEVRSLGALIGSVVGRAAPSVTVAEACGAPHQGEPPPYAALLADLAATLGGRASASDEQGWRRDAPPLIRPRIHANDFYRCLLHGALDGAHAVVGEALGEALAAARPGAVGLAVGMRAELSAMVGNLAAAAVDADEALWLLRDDDESGVREIAIAVAAQVEAEAGRLDQAQRMLGMLRPREDLRVELRAVAARVRVETAVDLARAEQTAMRALSLGVERGNVFWAALAGLHALRAGVRGELPAALAALAAEGDGALLGAIEAYARACEYGGPDDMATAGDALAQCGLARAAAEAWLAAAADADDSRFASRVRARAATALAPLGAPRLVDRSAGLSDRERQVARLAAAGATSARIATDLSLSVRTVDNHLRAVYMKTGVDGRAGLTDVLLV